MKTFLRLGDKRINMAQIQWYEKRDNVRNPSGEGKYAIILYFGPMNTVDLHFPSEELRDAALTAIDAEFACPNLRMTG